MNNDYSWFFIISYQLNIPICEFCLNYKRKLAKIKKKKIIINIKYTCYSIKFQDVSFKYYLHFYHLITKSLKTQFSIRGLHNLMP